MRQLRFCLMLFWLAVACAPTPTPAVTPLPAATPIRFPTATPDVAALTPSPTATLVVRITPAASQGTPSTPATPTPKPIGQNPFGLMLGPDSLGIEKRVALVKSLGGVYFRPWDVIVDEWRGACAECAAIEASGLKVLLTVRANGGAQTPTSPPKDLNAYSRTLAQILDRRRPEVLVVENEENSAQFFYTGTPSQYGDELKAACQVAHSKGIKCANGGLVSGEVVLLVWANYLEKNLAANGCGFARRALETQQAQMLCNARALDQLPPLIQDDLAKGKALVQAYKAAGVDYVNFHWYVPDPGALEEAVAFLQTATGLKAITNEMGQQSDNVGAVAPLLQKVLDLGLPYAIWYSVDAPRARALNNPDGSLRPTGEAFKAFMQTRFR